MFNIKNKNASLGLHFVITGGTIDSYYEGTKDTVIPHRKSIIPSFIKSLKLYERSLFTQVCMKDSRSLNQKDLKNILKTVEKSPCRRIIIPHGTYTMPDTARFLRRHLERRDQTIVLTGSMIPLYGFSPSDGPFSLGYSIAKSQELPPGIYICMNGKVFSPEEVTKLIQEGRFISLFADPEQRTNQTTS